MGERKYTILLADDEKEIVDLLSLYLESAGFDVIGVYSGTEALDMISSNDVKIDAAVVDIMMPGMDGYTLVRKSVRPAAYPLLSYLPGATTAERYSDLISGLMIT